jgi:D-alanine-D-alanine ligase
MSKIKIAIISGGWLKEKDISIKRGNSVHSALNKDKYDVVMYYPSRDLDLMLQRKHSIDLVFILRHGRFGEDGCIQGLLNILMQ